MSNGLINLLIIIGAKYLIFLLILIVIIFFFKQKSIIRKKIAIFAFISLPLTYLIAKLSALFYFDPRPFVVGHFKPLISHVADNGFPSDHVLLSSALAMVIFYYKHKAGLIILILAVLIGIARILVGVHHSVDIWGSIIIAVLVSLTVYYLIIPRLANRFYSKNK